MYLNACVIYSCNYISKFLQYCFTDICCYTKISSLYLTCDIFHKISQLISYGNYIHKNVMLLKSLYGLQLGLGSLKRFRCRCNDVQNSILHLWRSWYHKIDLFKIEGILYLHRVAEGLLMDITTLRFLLHSVKEKKNPNCGFPPRKRTRSIRYL